MCACIPAYILACIYVCRRSITCKTCVRMEVSRQVGTHAGVKACMLVAR